MKALLKLTGVLLACLALAAFPPALDLLRRPLEVQERLQPADVIVAVSAARLDNCRAHPNLFVREQRAANLLKQGYSRSGKLLISGIYTRPTALAECRRHLARTFGIQPGQLVIDNTARTTQENATHTVAMMARHGWRNALLVTSGSHLYRTVRTFRRYGVTVYPARVADLPPLSDAGFDIGRLSHIRRFLYEYGALIKYKWYGYI